ncbi:MAG: hypothetical protein JNJ71_05070 [Rubrivivax sp.]|nr:hypothetical protein [Rubrivivax sp.]
MNRTKLFAMLALAAIFAVISRGEAELGEAGVPLPENVARQQMMPRGPYAEFIALFEPAAPTRRP